MNAPLPPPPWRRATRTPRRQLTTETIVDTALSVLSAEGPDAVTMRRIAHELDTGPGSLYAHVQDKRELHELMLDAAMRVVETPEPDPQNWRTQLKQLCLEQARVLTETPGIAQIAMETLIPTTPGILVAMDGMLGILRCSGIPDDRIAAAGDMLALHVTAYAYEASLWQSPSGQSDEAHRRLGQIGDYLQSLPADQLPNLKAMNHAMPHGTEPDHFEFALDVFIAGLAAHADVRP
ncbi:MULTISPECIES: TetR/AcrR family transcriptional regulator [Prauserella salsuginis group]|uniref:TetR/AcrR family transcriptional regulator n=1 Tax=Prauserella salsuginis TaxID=387889 RepID=A0ABW6G5Z7_9PSEU|nr:MULTISPECIES: TetR/AcrR family transcriptional regulator [Prauserella salsuginis group]MCR3719223.1 transcriptional regulator, TetR family [Prauserella flava]MCR3735764.1 transcriptional regulator, TetR family [Prauserella salsuginis]